MLRDEIDTLAKQTSGAERRLHFGPMPGAVRCNIPRGSLRLLVVEDEPTAAEAVRQAVIGLGHTVCGTAATEAAAVELARRERPDVALMDVRLAGGDGIAAARRLRTNVGVRSIFLSGYADHAVMARITEAYPLGVVHKPFSIAQLKLALDLAARRLRVTAG